MKIKPQLLKDWLNTRCLSSDELAEDLQISYDEMEKLLNGEEVGIQTATLFIHYFGANTAQDFIDWEAIDKKNPLANKL